MQISVKYPSNGRAGKKSCGTSQHTSLEALKVFRKTWRNMTNNSLCEELKQFYPTTSEVQDFYSVYILNCVAGAFLCYSTTILNILTIHAIRRTLLLPNTLRTLLLNLAVSDLGIGLVVQPLVILLQVNWLQNINPRCEIYIIFSVVMTVFSTTSFLGIMVITMDRLLALHLHLRYQEIVTHKRAFASVISIWVSSAFFSSRIFWLSSKVKYLLLVVSGVLCVVIIVLAYLRIYRILLRHKNRIQALQVGQQNVRSEISFFSNLRRSVSGTFYVYLLFLACYSPRFVSLAAFKISGPSNYLKLFSMTTSTLMFINSSLNPFIYCWKMKSIRNSVMNILGGMFRRTNWFQRRCHVAS